MYNTLRNSIISAIKTNNNRAITGDILQTKLIEIVNSLDLGGLFLGFANKQTTPNSQANGFYFSDGEGTYTNFLGFDSNPLVIGTNPTIIYRVESNNVWAWTKRELFDVDSITPSIDSNGNWNIGSDDTGISAKGEGVPTGGTANQVLAKNSSTNYDTKWVTLTNGTTDYSSLNNKPSINGHTLSGNKTSSDLGLATAAQGALATSAYQLPNEGIPKSDLNDSVKASLEKADTALQSTDVDSALSSSSTNPVQNKVINSALENKVNKDGNKVLSTNDFTNGFMTKLDNMPFIFSYNWQNHLITISDGTNTQVYQLTPYTEPIDYYIGWTICNESTFLNKNAQDLIEPAEPYMISTHPTYSHTCTNLVFYVLYNQTKPMTGGSLETPGLTTSFTTAFINSGGTYNHPPVEYDGVTYKVFSYADDYLISDNNIITITFQ